MPGSARLVLLAARASGAGCLRVYELQGAGLALRGEAASDHALQSGTFGASSLAERHLAAGDASGLLPQGFHVTVRLHCCSSMDACGKGAWEWVCTCPTSAQAFLNTLLRLPLAAVRLPDSLQEVQVAEVVLV